MSFCLPKFAADELRKLLKERQLTPGMLSEMSSAERRQALSVLGAENAKTVNLLFERKLLLKNQQKAMISWAEQILGLKNKATPDTIAKVKQMTEIMSEQDIQKFKEDLIAKKLGLESITQEEAGRLINLANTVDKLKPQVEEMYKKDKLTKEDDLVRAEYGMNLALFKRYVSDLKVKGLDSQVLLGAVKNPGGFSKSIVASFDNSFWGNQGIFTMLNPKYVDLWAKNLIKSFSDMAKELRGLDTTIATEADVFSRKGAVDGTYAREKLAIGLRNEEAYPTSLPEKIPLLGRLFGASSAAYKNAALRLRADVADRLNKIAEKSGVDLTNKIEAEAIGDLVNSMTGRGGLGRAEPISPILNNYLFSPRLLRSTFDTLTSHLFNKRTKASAFAMKQAAQNLLGIAATYMAIISMYEALNPGSTETDPRGAHFGQVKVGNSWVNITGPLRPMLRTLSTLIPSFHNGEYAMWRKTATGKWMKFEVFPNKAPKYGAIVPLDIAEGFFEGKASPALAVVLDIWRQKDFNGNPPTPEGEASRLLTPISIQQYLQDKDNPNVDDVLKNTILNALGFSASTPK
mgnify:CR=1 FL=1